MKTRIIVDSTADMPPELKARVHVVPLSVRFGDEEYVDGVTIDHRTFYEKLLSCPDLPTTSQATPEQFAAAYEAARAAGESAVVITLSSKLSGTYQSAVIAAQEFDDVRVVDSGTGAMGGGILTELALSLVDGGADAATVAATLEEAKRRIVIVALVDTLEYLKRGGRISKTTAFAGALLGIKPVLSVIDGEIAVLGKARGSKLGGNLLTEQITAVGGVDFSLPVLMGYSGLSDDLLRQYIEDSRPLWEGRLATPRYTSVGSVIGTHAGPGAVVVAFFRNP